MWFLATRREAANPKRLFGSELYFWQTDYPEYIKDLKKINLQKKFPKWCWLQIYLRQLRQSRWGWAKFELRNLCKGNDGGREGGSSDGSCEGIWSWNTNSSSGHQGQLSKIQYKTAAEACSMPSVLAVLNLVAAAGIRISSKTWRMFLIHTPFLKVSSDTDSVSLRKRDKPIWLLCHRTHLK